MSKKPRSISIDEDLDERLRERNVNVSAVINEFLREYFVGGDAKSVAKQLRLQDIEREIEDAQSERDRLARRIERLRKERSKIEKEMEENKSERRDTLVEFYEEFGMVEEVNPVVEAWADKVEMEPKRFVEELTEEIQ
jgi:chromosome segregation ATPase